MKTKFLKQFYKDIDKIPSQILRVELIPSIQNVKASAAPAGIRGLKKLSGQKNAFRRTIQDFRIGILIENDNVEFVRILHRKDIYKVFP